MTPARPGEGEEDDLDGKPLDDQESWWTEMPRGGRKAINRKLYDEAEARQEEQRKKAEEKRKKIEEEKRLAPPERTEQDQRQTLDGLRKLHELPKLAFNKSEAKATTYRDWVDILTMQVEAVSQDTTNYWEKVCAEVKQLHQKYLSLPAAQKPNLQITSEAAGGYKDIERSIRPMILKTLPKYLQDQLLARGDVNVTKCLLEACIEAAPGGQEDKGAVLGMLQFPRTANSPAEALKILRSWRQAWQRTAELQVTRPDSTLMLVGLRQVVAKVEKENQDFKFRSSTYLNENSLPFQVDEPKLLRLWEYLLGEMREMAAGTNSGLFPIAAAGFAGKGKDKGKGFGKAKGGDDRPRSYGQEQEGTGKGKGEGKKNVVCRFFASQKGCGKGGQCPFWHDKLSPESGRCFVCGSTDHRSGECPAPRRGKGQAGEGKGKQRQPKEDHEPEQHKPRRSWTEHRPQQRTRRAKK